MNEGPFACQAIKSNMKKCGDRCRTLTVEKAIGIRGLCRLVAVCDHVVMTFSNATNHGAIASTCLHRLRNWSPSPPQIIAFASALGQTQCLDVATWVADNSGYPKQVILVSQAVWVRLLSRISTQRLTGFPVKTSGSDPWFTEVWASMARTQ